MQFSTGIIALAATLFTAVSGNPIIDSNAEPVESAELTERQSSHISYTNDADFQRTMLDAHNFFRWQHGETIPATWNAKRALDSANYAKQCKFAHSGASGAGENRKYSPNAYCPSFPDL